MTEQLRIRGWLSARLPPDIAAAYERAAERVKKPNAKATQRAYEDAWAAWANYCAEVALKLDAPFPPLPVEAQHLVSYLDHLAPNTVRLRLAALCKLDQTDAVSKGEKRDPLRRHPVVQRWLGNWSRDHPIAPRQRAAAITPAELRRVIEYAAEPGFNQSRPAHAARYARDRCILALGVNAALRVSELGELDLADVAQVPEGLLVRVRRAKNDQHGNGQVRALHPQTNRAVCPVEAFRQWLGVRGIEPGPLFLPIARNGALEAERLSRRQCMRIITERCQAVGLEHVTSHSLRATFGTLAKNRPTSDVMAHAGWKSVAVAMGYQRQGALFDDSPTKGLFDE